MIQIFKHRVNTLEQLKEVKKNWGVEIDIRSSLNVQNKLHLSHDAWVEGIPFETWLQEYKFLGINGPILLNTKEDGLEEVLVKTMKKNGISNYFFLDTSFPSLTRLCLLGGNTNFFIRLSKYEPIEQVLHFIGRAEWLWVDCFEGKPVNFECLKELEQHFKICLVSPELHGLPIESILDFKESLRYSSGVCSKVPQEWIKLLNQNYN